MKIYIDGAIIFIRIKTIGFNLNDFITNITPRIRYIYLALVYTNLSDRIYPITLNLST
jgi:hypothetical protein